MLLSYPSDIALESRSSQPERPAPPVQRQAASSRAAEFAICDQTIEESFRDDKSTGFAWDHSRVRDPVHRERLLLVLQLAVCFVLAQGTFVLQHGFRSILERHDRRTLSIFSLGLRWFAYAREHFASVTTRLHFTFT